MSSNIFTDTDPEDDGSAFDEDELMARIPDGWHIQLNKKPIPWRQDDYDFWHDDCDLDSDLYGTAKSIQDALLQISEIMADK